MGLSQHKVVGIIQARMGSERLPGKSMLPLNGKSLLYNYIQRVKRAELLDEVVLATTTLVEDDVLEKEAKKLDIKVFRGSAFDLIDRIYRAAVEQEAGAVVRLCADNPMVEPKEIDRIVQRYQSSQIAGVLYTNTQNVCDNRYPDGLGAEVYGMMDFKALRRQMRDVMAREHPHLYFYAMNQVETVRCPEEFAYPQVVLDVNTQPEYEKIRRIYSKFKGNDFHVTDYIKELI